ncbi:ABC transporter permease [Burkholderia plantarii]|uniref:ABC sugar transporter, inner membrane protein n=1 Tax=Burkholderia plantarii TaxID=41899 RepID=A0A0B6RNK1_BURPL|nr:ABC transporter permease [Burkholderia plantarii]AJK46867.1 ABC sugar transporter, inner membrane protein [Burkholderia plantarii]ALK31046.1 sugar ABC transporter permease [Burkholderia plantarii]WLE59695.1 ABC transporter permease [Burkholderia plantarii]
MNLSNTPVPRPPADAARAIPGRAALLWARDNSVYVALALLVALNLAITPGFSNPLAARSLLFEAAPVILIALGQNLAIATRGIDLSVGSVMALASATLAVCLDYGTGTAIAAGIAAGLVVGLFNGALVSIVRIDPLISGLALLVAARGLAQALVGGSRVSLPPSDAFDLLGTGALGPLPVVMAIALGLALLTMLVVRRTTFGRYTILIGASRGAAYLAGIPVRGTLFLVYAASGGLAGLAGVFASARLGASDPNYVGVNFELDAIAASVIGGTPLSGGRISVVGTVFGVLLLQVLDASFIMNNVSFTYAQILKAVFIVVALYLQRQGG